MDDQRSILGGVFESYPRASWFAELWIRAVCRRRMRCGVLHGTLVVVACELDRVLTLLLRQGRIQGAGAFESSLGCFLCLVSRGPLLCASGTAPLHDARLPSAHDSVGRLSETVSKDAGLSRRLGRAQRPLARRS